AAARARVRRRRRRITRAHRDEVPRTGCSRPLRVDASPAARAGGRAGRTGCTVAGRRDDGEKECAAGVVFCVRIELRVAGGGWTAPAVTARRPMLIPKRPPPATLHPPPATRGYLLSTARPSSPSVHPTDPSKTPVVGATFQHSVATK